MKIGKNGLGLWYKNVFVVKKGSENNMENDKIEKYVEGRLIINEKERSNERIRIHEELFSSVIKSLKEHKKIIETKDTVEEIKKSSKTLYEVTMRPELQEGINCGDYKWKDCALEIKNANTGKYVGKATLEKSDDIDTREIKTTVIRDYKESAISKVTRNICSISGQVQLAEISQRLDVLIDKVDEIKELLIDKEVYNLKACIETIDNDTKLLPDSNAINRINNAIGDLRKLSKFFEGEIQKVINKKVKYNIRDTFVEGLNIIDLLKGEIKEYNNKYVDEIKVILNRYSFLVDCYFQSLISLGICYQILYGYTEAKEYYEKARNDANKFSLELSNKLVYLLDIQTSNGSECMDLNKVIELLKDRKIMLKQELVNVNSYMENISNKYNNLTHQFNEIEIKLLISDEELLKEEDY
ncbi:hypothetical protein [uncultured Clostridium sp.]|uniref:hypothetical protein n=1 Tax=uncultured Clostridium sp. TaxID=59620 RepID=UPI00258D5F99|nr:hypothetical protein [uncultured Clostridium sp.]